MRKLVSVILPCYNAGQYLDASIQSVLDQSWHNIELIIVDDGSTDNSTLVVRKYLSETVKLIEQENKGACAARNIGLNISKGEFIQFLDADDMLSPGKIEEQMLLLNNLDSSAVSTCKWQKFENHTNIYSGNDFAIFKDYDDPVNLLTEMWNAGEMMQTAVWLTPRALLLKAGKWDEALKINQDGEYFCRVLLHANQVLFANNGKVYYRSKISGSITGDQSSREKANSLLNSYKSYAKNILEVRDTTEIRSAITKHFYSFVYIYYNLFPDLVEEAASYITQLGEFPAHQIGGQRFQKLTSLFGFWGALRFREFIRNR
ncbi:glycosyltransferase family 2 protein [Flavihumibacter profundi]|uniref:glycosyltransferase family 2 protein n=1 Tax=Flavihumibacter profundi TaxID=2716883 RepID=UPI001CC795F9|nr:glycosyltransferase family 2 protein [Flavihumibacter profundi]MBZ5857997.1 glycosyltransferase [Flavihumibacter profundi]